MVRSICPNIVVYTCQNCKPSGGTLPRQWKQNGSDISVKQLPCSGKTDIQYLFRVFENGGSGVCVVTCPEGKCRLAQGNYRAEVRLKTFKHLLSEIGIHPDSAALLHYSPADSFEGYEQAIYEAVERILTLTAPSARTDQQRTTWKFEESWQEQQASQVSRIGLRPAS